LTFSGASPTAERMQCWRTPGPFVSPMQFDQIMLFDIAISYRRPGEVVVNDLGDRHRSHISPIKLSRPLGRAGAFNDANHLQRLADLCTIGFSDAYDDLGPRRFHDLPPHEKGMTQPLRS
jgi:hypothetical protein